MAETESTWSDEGQNESASPHGAGIPTWQFRLAVVRHHRLVYRIASALLRDAAEAEDVTQEAFLRLWQHGGGVRRQREWLLKVARHLCLDRLRVACRTYTVESAAFDSPALRGGTLGPGTHATAVLDSDSYDAAAIDSSTPDSAAFGAAALDAEREERGPSWHLQQNELAQRLHASIAALPEPQRSLVVLFDVHGLDGAACARILGISRNQVKVYLHRARRRLRRALESME